MALTTAAVVLVLCELALQLALPAHAFRQDWTDEFWIALRKGRICAELSKDLELDSKLGWRMRRNYSVAGVSHDGNGHRRTGVGSPDARAVLAIGDSFTYGLGVADAETYISAVGAATGRPAINAGVNAYGVDQAVLMWDEVYRSVRPSTVVLGIYFDDVHRSALTVRDAPKPYFKLGLKGELELQPPIDCSKATAPSSGLGSLRLARLASWSYRYFADRLWSLPLDMLEERTRLNSALLTRLRDQVREISAQLVVLLIPHCLKDGSYGDWILARVAKDCDVLGIDCIDFRAFPKQGMYGSNCHWSPAGHRMAADKILQRLSKSSQ